MSDSIVIAIPARFAASRLPGKPLLLAAGKPLIAHVIERARSFANADLVVATDDPRIAAVAEQLGVAAALTRAEHPTGSDRLAEVADQLGWSDDQIVVNLQGDEPLMPLSCLHAVVAALREDVSAAAATLATPATEVRELFDPSCVNGRQPDRYAPGSDSASCRALRLSGWQLAAFCPIAKVAAGTGRVPRATTIAGTRLGDCRASGAGADTRRHRYAGGPAAVPGIFDDECAGEAVSTSVRALRVWTSPGTPGIVNALMRAAFRLGSQRTGGWFRVLHRSHESMHPIWTHSVSVFGVSA